MSRWKRIADWLEKMSVACLAVGLFQGKSGGVILGVIAFAMSLYMTRKEE